MKRNKKSSEKGTRLTFTAVAVLSIMLLFVHCTKQADEEAKNIEQIYKEEGVPIRTEIVAGKDFKTEISFTSVLQGIKESPVLAAVGDEVEKIYVKVGDYVKKDQVLLSFPTDTPQAQYFQAKVAFENAEAAYKRIEKLYKSGGISLQDRDNAKAAYEVAKANWHTARQTVKVRSPISGYVAMVGVSETENVRRDTELFTISNTDRMKAYIWISEDQIFAVEKGMAAVAAWQGYKIEGEVVQVDMAMNQAKNAFRALVEFDNPDNLLKAGITVEINIITSNKPGAIVVKRQHIIKEQNRSFVYMVEDGKARKQEIKTGHQHVLDVEVLEGLNPGDELVVEGQQLLEPGGKVKVIK